MGTAGDSGAVDLRHSGALMGSHKPSIRPVVRLQMIGLCWVFLRSGDGVSDPACGTGSASFCPVP